MIADVRSLAKNVLPVGKNLRAVLESYRDTGGIERLMDYIFYQAAAINGFDATGHYLRAGLLVNTCVTYSVAADRGLLGELPADQRHGDRGEGQRRGRGRRRPGR